MNPKPHKKLGVIVSVDGSFSQVGMYSLSNDTEYIWYGEVLTGPKIGAYLTINQNDIKIIATVSKEKIIDQQNSIKSSEFDNRFSKNSINRIIVLKTKGIIEKNSFFITSQYVPMVGNEVTLTSMEDLQLIYGSKISEPSIKIGHSLMENQQIFLPINNIFASHIGVFGNTGSGKSNTLHKLYLELFKTSFREKIFQTSKFFIIDFNGEYTQQNSFGIKSEKIKKIYNLDTRGNKSCKIPINKNYLFDPDILSILFGASSATQVPFLRKALQIWNQKNFTGETISHFVVGTLKKILTTGNAASQDAKNNWISVAKKYLSGSLDVLDNLTHKLHFIGGNNQSYKYQPESSSACQYINPNEEVSSEALKYLKIPEIESELKKVFDFLSPIDKLKFHLDFQKVHQSAWNYTNIEHINPLFHRIDTALSSLKKVVEVIDNPIDESFLSVNIINLVHANQEISRLIPMLLTKMVYDSQKSQVAGGKVLQTKHIIIDEAHNILNPQQHLLGDNWQDYRMSVFEEIVKEGRKFGFYLTLSSQRPADISPTILSQIHNFFIHRLVNDNDLRMLTTTMPTLDRTSFEMIPSLGKGETVITGVAINIPLFVKVDKDDISRPNSDDIILTNLWS